MTDVLWWLTGGAFRAGMEGDLLRATPTIVLSVLVVCGYAAVAFNWYFHTRVGAPADAKAALRRLRGIALTSVACAVVFVLADMGWSFWGLYDVALLVLVCHTWWFVMRMRGGLRLVDQRLAKVDELEQTASAAVAASEQARQKAFFFNAISHDLRAPLNNVVLNAHLLKIADLGNNDLNKSVDVVIENATAAGDLITRLLDFARIGADEHNEVEAIQVDELLRQLERRFHPQAAAKNVSLHLIGDRPTVVSTDRVKLERILSNLLDNAVKFTADGGITVELIPSSDGVTISVTDTGTGVPAGHVPHLFDEFYQAGNQERDRKKGFGMGLAICRCLARQLGGDVVLAHTGAGGSRFDVTVRNLPAGGAKGEKPASDAAAGLVTA